MFIQTEESNPEANPSSFIEGLPAYVSLVNEDTGQNMGQFLLNTSGTISYAFTDALPAVTPEIVYFKDYPSKPVEVYFDSVTISLPLRDVNTTRYDVTMDMGFIPTTYQNKDYFYFYQQGSLGLASTITTSNYLSRQFLYQATVAKVQGLSESYVLDGTNFTFAIGGDVAEISQDPDMAFHFISILNNAISDYVPSLGYNNSLQYSDDRIDTII